MVKFRHPKYYQGPPLEAYGVWGGGVKEISGVLAQGHCTVTPLGPLTQLVVSFLVRECIIKIKMLRHSLHLIPRLIE